MRTSHVRWNCQKHYGLICGVTGIPMQETVSPAPDLGVLYSTDISSRHTIYNIQLDKLVHLRLLE